MDDAQLRTVWQHRQIRERAVPLSNPLTMLMKHTLGKRVRQLSQIGRAWDELIPDHLREHTALETYSRGVLTVLVDSSPHRFQLKTLLDTGLHKALQEKVVCAISKIRLVPGQFSAVDLAGSQRYQF